MVNDANDFVEDMIQNSQYIQLPTELQLYEEYKEFVYFDEQDLYD